MEKRLIDCSALLLLSILVLVFGCDISCVNAEVYAEYTIEEGDYLSVVALLFNTTVDDIMEINNISDVNTISIGTKIKIPTLAGIEGTIANRYVNIGDTLSTLSILSGMDQSKLGEINSIVSPTELYIGSLLTTIYNDSADHISAVGSYDDGDTLLTKSAELGVSPVVLEKVTQTSGTWDFADSQILFGIAGSDDAEYTTHAVSPFVDVIEIKQLPLTQGGTHVIHISGQDLNDLSGFVGDYGLRFFRDGETNDQYAMLGIDAMQEPGLYRIEISGKNNSGESFAVSQPIIIEAGIFTNEVVEGVDSSTLEEENQELDTNTVKSLTETSSTRTWGTMMSYPVDEPCFASAFGSRRTYNDGSFHNYHSGVDFSVCLADNINIYAAADGKVIFAAELPIHGNYTVIDHGWGVYTSYSHQSQLLVEAGQEVKRGDLIGLIGNTGRSVGPHLHWEVIINSVYVNPMTWLSTQYP